jgi:hypothetical protein
MLRIGGWHSHILGGIKLQVCESEAQDTMPILQHAPPLDGPRVFQENLLRVH